jgi:hypothetical protein
LDTQCNGENEASWQISIKQAAKSALDVQRISRRGKSRANLPARCRFLMLRIAARIFPGYLFPAIFSRLSFPGYLGSFASNNIRLNPVS